MRAKIFPLTFLICFILTGCMESKITALDVEIFNGTGDSLGVAKVSEDPNGVKIELNLEGLPPGEHAVHIHETGLCDAPDFKTAGNHFNPDDKQHGLMHPEGAHVGDLPNIIVEDDGTVIAELMAPQATLEEGKTSLFGKDGTAIIITENIDDGMTQPAGDSGERIACGVITKEVAEKNEAVEEPVDEAEKE
ncbi:superoxide dismutase family protein [Sutcliffiella horikoshii]|uniref:Superoxide dismutase [Cu-Zn] n=1 Tax=Sutcliffiella horikoshii TaxID=79883 RepID=A0A1Y0CRD4_9BACI|nr:superoxide dismutase family protein [Sutcliffiella horikoshii]ART77819.1 superoxide dismutase [Sutcliffiella horikoshii]TYS60232.1 superoxide dismutase family protein [Sutcliffiella horikoshii]